LSRLVALVGTYSLLALGLNLFFGYCGQVSFGHAGFYAIGAYSAVILAIHFQLPFFIAIPSAVVITTVVAAVVGLPLMRIRGHYLALATLAFGEIIYYTTQKWFSVTGGDNGLDVPSPDAFGYSFDGMPLYYLILITVALSFVACQALVSSRVGRAMVAIGQDEAAALSLGIHITKYKTISFMLSGLFAGLAGGLFAYYSRWIAPESFSVQISILSLVMIVIGGLGSNLGSIIGAIFVVVMPELLRGAVGDFSSLDMLVWGFVIIFSLYYMPRGVAGLLARNTRLPLQVHDPALSDIANRVKAGQQ